MRRVAGHAIASYFSAQTGKPFPLVIQRVNETIEIQGHTSVAVYAVRVYMRAAWGAAAVLRV